MSTCVRDRWALQKLALNVHIKHSDLTWPDLTWPATFNQITVVHGVDTVMDE